MSGEQAAPRDAEQLLEEMPCGLLVTRMDGTIVRVNATFCRWIGMSAAELVGAKKLQELLTVGARIFHQTHWLPMLQMQGSISEVKFDVKAKDGRRLPMILNVMRRTADAGTFDEVCAFIAEDRNRYEKELLAARKRADSLVVFEKDRALFAEQMVGIVSHDLRNPLSVVLMAAKALSTRGVDLSEEQAQRMLANITRAAERSRRLVDDLLDFTVARVGNGLSVSREMTNVHLVTEKAVEELALAYPGRGLRHRGEGAAQAYADGDRLSQLLGNLVSNAMAYGDPTRDVTVSSLVEEGTARLAVHNFGNPIPANMLTAVFEPMVRGETPGSAQRNVGLGLFIVKAIAAAHDGRVEVTSSVEDGPIVAVSFPASPGT